MSDAPDMPDPDKVAAQVARHRAHARKALLAAGVKVGGDHLIEPIVAALHAECMAMRDLFSSVAMTLQTVETEGDVLDSLLMSIRQGYLDKDGNVQLALGDE